MLVRQRSFLPRSNNLKSTFWAGLVAALVALACGAPAALADSIAYVKDGNVFLSTPDGSRQFQVTSGGGYSDVSQADDGTMIALHGVRLHKLDRSGTVLADFDTPVSDTRPAPSKTFYGPFDPAISPDGTKVAYTYYYMTQSQNPTCFPPECVVAINEGGTGYSYSDRQTGWDEPGLGYHSGWRHPSWIDNDMTMLANPTHMPNRDIVLDRISDGGNGHGNMLMNWTSDMVDGNPHVSGGDITRDKRKLAFQTGENDSTLSVYSVPVFPTSWKDGDPDTDEVHVCYRYKDPAGGKYGVPTFSPDGSGLAFSTGDGIHVAAVPAFAAGCTTEGATVTPPVVIAGGSEPDWGPADVPADRGSSGEGGEGSGDGGGGGGSQGGPSNALSLKVLSASKRSGVKVRVKAPGRGKVSAIAKSGSRTVGKASKRVTKAGATSLREKVSRRGKVSVKVTFKPSSGAAVTSTISARVR
jgi:hypothetical protein